MPLPSAVQKMQDQADAWAAKNANAMPQAPDTSAAVLPVTPTPDQPQATPTPAAPQPQADPQPAPAAEDEGYWEKRYKSYKAATDETISQLRQQIEATNTTVANLQAQISKAPAQPQQSPADKEAAEYNAWLEMVLPNKEDREEYEESFLKFQFRAHKTNTQATPAAPVDNGIKQDLEQVKQVAAKTERELFYERMDRAFPNDGWIIDEKSPNWQQWVAYLAAAAGEYDTRSREQVLETALSANDSETVIKMVTGFKNAIASNQVQAPAAPVNPLESQLTPDDAASGSGAEVDANQIQPILQSQVNEIYANKTKGMYTPEEFAIMEKQIEAAGAAGKILPG